MARTISAPIALTTDPSQLQPGVSVANLPLTDGGVVSVLDVTPGMIDKIPRDKIPPGAGKIIKNGRIRDDWCGRREGTAKVGTKPDSNRVIGLFHIVQEDGSKLLCRVTVSTFAVWDGTSWVSFTVTGGFSGTSRRVSVAQLFDKIYISFDNSDGLWEVDFTAKTVEQVSEAPGGKFATTFAERIILANVYLNPGGHVPNGVSWSANSDGQDWDGETAGFEDLIGSELGNEITGLETLSNVAVVVRRKTIVHISRQPFAIAPFRFDTAVKGIGSDLPYTTVSALGGIIFADSRTNDVYFYELGNRPVSLAARNIDGHLHDLLFEDLAQAQHGQAGWDPAMGEYHLGLVWTTDNELITRHWICNIHRGVPIWSYDDSPTVSTFGAILTPPAATSINALTGTINALTGSIDSLSSRAVPQYALFAGTTTGEVIKYSYDYATDWDNTAYEFLFQSHSLGNPSNRRTMKDLEVNCSIPITGSVTIEQSRDESTWTNTKTASYTGASTKQKVRLPKTQITGDDLYWRIKSTANQFKFHSWWTRMMDKGLQAGGQQ